MELPRFNGEDPFWWILNVNEFFVLHNNSPHHMVSKIIFYKVVFGNLDLNLDLKLIDLKSRNFESIDFRSYFKSKHFKGLKSLVNLSNLLLLGLFSHRSWSGPSDHLLPLQIQIFYMNCIITSPNLYLHNNLFAVLLFNTLTTSS